MFRSIFKSQILFMYCVSLMMAAAGELAWAQDCSRDLEACPYGDESIPELPKFNTKIGLTPGGETQPPPLVTTVNPGIKRSSGVPAGVGAAPTIPGMECRGFSLPSEPQGVRLDLKQLTIDEGVKSSRACYPDTVAAIDRQIFGVMEKIWSCVSVANRAKEHSTNIRKGDAKQLLSKRNSHPSGGPGIESIVDAGINSLNRANAILSIAEARCAGCQSMSGACNLGLVKRDFEAIDKLYTVSTLAQLGNPETTAAAVAASSPFITAADANLASVQGLTKDFCGYEKDQARQKIQAVTSPPQIQPDTAALGSVNILGDACNRDLGHYRNKILGDERRANEIMKGQFYGIRNQISQMGSGGGGTGSTLAAVGLMSGATLILDNQKAQEMKGANQPTPTPLPAGLDPKDSEEDNKKKGFVKVDGKYVNCMNSSSDHYTKDHCRQVMVSLCQSDEFGLKTTCKAFDGFYCGTKGNSPNSNFCLIQRATDYCRQDVHTIKDSPACAWKAQRPASCGINPENVQCLLPMSVATLDSRCRNYGLDPICKLRSSRVVTQPDGSGTEPAAVAGVGNRGVSSVSGAFDQSSLVGPGLSGGGSALIQGNSALMQSLQANGTLR